MGRLKLRLAGVGGFPATGCRGSVVGGLPGTNWLGLCQGEVVISGEGDLGDSHRDIGDSFLNDGGSNSSSKGGSM
jgi:hypothetical protein